MAAAQEDEISKRLTVRNLHGAARPGFDGRHDVSDLDDEVRLAAVADDHRFGAAGRIATPTAQCEQCLPNPVGDRPGPAFRPGL
jgi:hypothetical protein